MVQCITVAANLFLDDTDIQMHLIYVADSRMWIAHNYSSELQAMPYFLRWLNCRWHWECVTITLEIDTPSYPYVCSTS